MIKFIDNVLFIAAVAANTAFGPSICCHAANCQFMVASVLGVAR